VSLETIAPAPEAVDVADRLPHIGRGTLSLDVTSGSDELRAALGLAPADCAGAARLAFRRGWHVVKLNVNVGLPGETDADVEATIRLARQIRDIGHAEIDGRAQVQVVAAPFIARAHGPWQRAALPDGEQWDKRVSLLAQGVRGPSLRLVWRGLDTRLIEAALARGDRRLSAVIEGVWRSGVRRAADNRNIALWQAAFASADLNMAFYAARPRSTDEILPWQHIDIGG
jgi:hypothetical protein